MSRMSPSFAAASSSRSTPSARHMRRSVPNWLIRSGSSEPFGFSNRSAGAACLDGAVDDLGDLEVGVDLGRDALQLALALEERDPVAQVLRWRRQGASQSTEASAYATASSSRGGSRPAATPARSKASPAHRGYAPLRRSGQPAHGARMPSRPRPRGGRPRSDSRDRRPAPRGAKHSHDGPVTGRWLPPRASVRRSRAWSSARRRPLPASARARASCRACLSLRHPLVDPPRDARARAPSARSAR